MLAVRFGLLAATLYCLCRHYTGGVVALPQQAQSGGAISGSASMDELVTCEQQLIKYRKFLLQAILSFEDVCDAYNADATSQDAGALFRHYQPVQQQQIWAFFKLLMAQFNDVEFTNVIREAVIERCHMKSQQQRDEKRNPNGLVLGKKQRFHSWGGKRSGGLLDAALADY